MESIYVVGGTFGNVKMRSRDSRELGVGRRRVRFAGSRPRLPVGPRGVERLGREGKHQRLQIYQYLHLQQQQQQQQQLGANSTGPMGKRGGEGRGEQSSRTIIGSRTEFEV